MVVIAVVVVPKTAAIKTPFRNPFDLLSHHLLVSLNISLPSVNKAMIKNMNMPISAPMIIVLSIINPRFGYEPQIL